MKEPGLLLTSCQSQSLPAVSIKYGYFTYHYGDFVSLEDSGLVKFHPIPSLRLEILKIEYLRQDFFFPMSHIRIHYKGIRV